MNFGGGSNRKIGLPAIVETGLIINRGAKPENGSRAFDLPYLYSPLRKGGRG